MAGGVTRADECGHPTRRHYARGMCSSCYQGWLNKNNPDRARATKKAHLKWRSGISLEEYELRYREQGGVCAICRSACPKALAADHCHTTGKIRGLLCTRCNVGIGMFRDSVRLLFRAVTYLVERG